MTANRHDILEVKSRCDILLVGQTPPPFHGQAVVTGILFDHDWGDLKVKRLRMAFSDDMESVGEASWVKVWRLVILVMNTWKVVLTSRPRILYYLPASPNMNPVVRDVIYLACVRWLFPKTVFHYHAGGLDDFYRGKKWLRCITKWVYNGADISIDVNVTEPPSGQYFDAKRNVVVMNGLGVGEAQRKRAQTAEFQLLYVGLLCKQKGVQELVETAKLIRDAGCSCEIVLVGGWDSVEFKDEFMALAVDAGVDDMFTYSGIKKGDDKWQAYADADAFIFPTKHPTETFGLVLIEAMAFALPIVTTRWRGIPHVVGDGGSAVVCEAGNTREYAAALCGIIAAEDTRLEMGKASKLRYDENFTKERFLQGMKKVFDDLLKGQAA